MDRTTPKGATMITSKRQQASKVRHERKRALLTKKRNYARTRQLEVMRYRQRRYKVRSV